jgi:serine phosphatase RsbU (regulator of sigma subunit)
MKKRLFYGLFLFLSVVTTVSAQTPHVDSLKKVLALHPAQDTARVSILIQICKGHIYETNDMDQLEYYNAQLYPLAQALNSRIGLAYAYLYKGILSKIRTDYPQAKLHLDHSLTIFKTLNFKSGIAACYINMGLVEDRIGNYKKAIEYANAAAKLRKESGDIRGTASALNNLAISYANLGDYKKSLNSYFKSLELRESIHDKLGMSVSYLNIGDSYNIQGKFDESEKFLMKALPLKKELGDKEGEAYVYANLASIATSRKNFNQALILHLKALKLREEMGDKQNINQTYVFIGKNYFDQKKYNEALIYYLKAFDSSKDLGDKVNYIEGAVGAGKCYEKRKEYQQAISKYNEASRVAKEINYRSGLSEVWNSLASVEEKLQNYKDALAYQKSFTQLKDSMLNEASFKQAAELNTRYETDKKEKEILLLTKDQQLKDKTLKQQRLVRIGLISGLALLFILSFLLFNRYQYKQKANIVLKKQKQEITEKNTQIVDSIDYAKNIQEAILPDAAKLASFLNDHFILYRPKAIVSGDFYWIGKKDDKFICAVADCTGHGVPGAFMSLLGHNILETVVQRKTSINPGAILTTLNEEIVARFSKGKEKETVKHGMDIAIISFDSNKQQLEYAGARNSLYLVREHQLTEVKADKMSTGIVNADHTLVQYTNHVFDIKTNDIIYLFSDGFPDQKGGPEKKKFYYQPFKNLLTSVSDLPVEEQKQKLDTVITQWMGEIEQIDDILVMGIRF